MEAKNYNFTELTAFFTSQIDPQEISKRLDELAIDYLMKSLECECDGKFHTAIDVNDCVSILMELSKVIRKIAN